MASVNFNSYNQYTSDLFQNTAGSNSLSSLTSSILGSSSQSLGTYNLLTDYASIKNGSYTKLLKAYYKKEGTSSSASKDTTAASTEDTAQKTVSNSAANLGKAASAMTGETITKDNLNTAQSQISDYVDAYNSLINSADDSSSKQVLQRTLWLTHITGSNESLLADVGITINADNTLKLDKTALSKADITSLNSLFTAKNSMAAKAYEKATQIYGAANNMSTAKAATYTSAGDYTKYNTVSMYNSFI